MITVIRVALAAAFLAAPKMSMAAQQTGEPSTFSDVTRAAWYNVDGLIKASAAKMPEEHYEFRPAREVRTFAGILRHIASEHFTVCGALTGRIGRAVELDKLKTKADIRKALDDSGAVCDMAYGLLTDQNAAFRYRVFDRDYSRLALLTSNVTHDSEHYGNLVTYLRLKRIVPPSTDR